MKNRITFYFLIFHLCVVFIFSDLIPIKFFSEEVHQSVAVYANWTGGGHGYSFFAPDVGFQNVAKSFTLNRKGELLVDAYGSGENNLEVRLSSFIHSMHSSNVPELTARMIASYCFGKYNDSNVVTVSLGKYNVPDIKDYEKGERPVYEEYYKATFLRNSRKKGSGDENNKNS